MPPDIQLPDRVEIITGETAEQPEEKAEEKPKQKKAVRKRAPKKKKTEKKPEDLKIKSWDEY